MQADGLLRVLSLCIVLASAETLHGIARTVWVVPRIGKDLAIKLSAATGSALAFAICFVLVPGIGLATLPAHAVLGLVLALFMALFDITIGRLLMHKAWKKIWPDFNPATGNYLLFGLVFLAFAPVLVSWLRASA